ncbi:hypothetical protein DFS33DRAFT_544920 [Desarmillaria ectypa]|nr:hypothetical protein DFS33DRAFT_544920 [Desarmillaria ectypa]
MTTISIDIAGVVGEIRDIISSIKENRVAQKEKRKTAQLLVYRALSLHPALESMKPPTGMLADVDWYHELRKPSFVAGIFRKLGQNEHFKTTALLGETGTRARIMMLLLWIIGHRLSEDEVGRLLSHTLGDAFRVTNSLSVTLATELMQLDSVKPVLVSLRKMIKTKLPLPPDRNPFVGEDYNPADEDKVLPHAELWGYELPEEMRYEYDVRRNPSLLLQPLQGSVIIPQTKLTLLLIRWASSNFGLGKKIYSAEELDSTAFWNADPPESDEEMLAMEWSSDEDDDDYAFEVHDGMAAPIYEVVFDGPLEGWIHERFCAVYPVHGWAHNSFARILLFNAFCSTQSFPEERDIVSAIHIADRLCQKYPLEVILYMQPFVVARSLLLWKENFEHKPWVTNFSEWTRRQRGMALIFSDPVKWDMEQNVMDVELKIFREVRQFLFDPLRSCQHVGDILSLPLLSEPQRPSEGELLSLDFSGCICGECASIYSSFSPSLQTFHQHYYFVTESRPDGCTAWVDAWEPILEEAEDWFGELTSRVESQFMLYPILDAQRAGPAVLEVCRRMGIDVGADISDADLLRFLVALTTIGDDRPDSTTTRLPATTSVSLPVHRGDSGLGYVVKRPWADDREEYLDDLEESPVDHVLFVTGGWLYDLVGIDGVTLLHSREDVSISYHTLFPGKFSAVCMPSFRPDFPGWVPQLHDEEELQTVDPIRVNDDGDQGHMSIFLSNLKSDGFPLLSVLDKGSTTPRGAVAVFIQVRVAGRVVETAYRPVVRCGRACEHREQWGRMTHCARTSYEVLERVLPPSDDELSTSADSNILESEISAAGQEAYILRKRMQVISDRLVKLSEAGALLERNRACIIRCGARDGPIDPIIVLAASLKKKIYVIHRSECWDCAVSMMQEFDCTVGLAEDVKVVKCCRDCLISR